MLILSMKKKIALLLCLVLMAIIALVTGIAVSSAANSSVPFKGTIVIDPGHGGRDGGVVGSTGLKESDVNLAIAQALRGFLRENGYNVVMTRNSDVDLASGSGSYKKSDMQARKKIIEEAEPDLVVSIHQNSYPLSSAKGAQVFYAEGSEKSEAYAEEMQSVLAASLGTDRVHKTGDYYILQCTEYPSMLIECGFLTNPEEEALLATDDYKTTVAYSICCGIQNILSIDNENLSEP